NKYTQNLIDTYGEVVLLLGVRKAESSLRSRAISDREIEGKILVPHSDFKNAYVYNPLTEIKNERVWEYLLKEDRKSQWGMDVKYLFSMYQGEDLSEEQSFVGQVDKSKIPSTGNSRFGCWCCTIVKEDKSLQKFIDNGSTELIPLRDFRNWLVSIRQNPEYRDTKRRNGQIYKKKNGEYGFGPFTLNARYEILKKLLKLQKDTKFNLITIDELKTIDTLWDLEGDLSRRRLVDLYYEVFGIRLLWDKYKTKLYDDEIIDMIKATAQNIDVPFELISKLLVAVDKNKYSSRSIKLRKEFDKIINQEWIHYDKIQEEILDED
ncbi:MAG TPA: DNA phosphorothioation system sulfurtransferase DndC, partial [Gallicola sp.]|nr:DNA phosphorothioation system sulfurtransferase DndC [Gallicola sp.]